MPSIVVDRRQTSVLRVQDKDSIEVLYTNFPTDSQWTEGCQWCVHLQRLSRAAVVQQPRCRASVLGGLAIGEQLGECHGRRADLNIAWGFYLKGPAQSCAETP